MSRLQSARLYLRFLAVVIAVPVGMGLLGVLPTVRLGGVEALRAMAAGCTISIVASAVGAVPMALWRGGSSAPVATLLASTALRFGIAVVLAAAVAWGGPFEIVPLLIWVATSYIGLLVVDTHFALKALEVQ